MPPLAASAACPMCARTTVLEGQLRGYPLRTCTACGHRYFAVPSSPRRLDDVFADDYFFGGGAGYPVYTASRESLIAQGRHYGRLLRRYAAPGRLIDVGAAAGFLTLGFRKEGWNAVGIEPNARMAAYARETVGVDVRVASVESHLAPEPVHAVAAVQVLAHFQDPIACLRRMHSWLLPDGLLLLETWNSSSLVARLQGDRWHELSPPSVLHLFNRRSLKRALETSGFQMEHIGVRVKPIRLAHAVELLRHSQGPDSAWARRLARLPQGLTLPYPGDDLVWCVARKTGAMPGA